MLCLGLILCFVQTCFCANILCVLPLPFKSHQIVYQPIWKELSLRGHNVTVLTPNPLNEPNLQNLTEIDMGYTYDIMQKHFDASKILSKNNMFLNAIFWTFDMAEKVTVEYIFKSKYLFRNSKNTSFDLILVEAMHPLVYAFGCRFKAPVVAISSTEILLHSHDSLGNPTHPVLNPCIFFNFADDVSLYDKMRSIFYSISYRLLYYGYILPRYDRITKKYFGDDCPFFGDLERNVSLFLMSSNPVLRRPRPTVPAFIEIDQIHIHPRKPLPQDLQNFLDQSPDGVVYFSLGSTIKSFNLPKYFIKTIAAALSELPYRVIWKWEADWLPDQPQNVIFRKWLPQQDILAHKNVKVFVTQGGSQSIEEAITYGVPLVGIPFVTEQPRNILQIVKKGIGVGIDHNTMTKDDLKNAIVEVAENQKYKENAKIAQNLLLDQPIKGLDKAIWWIEYVIRNKGARHLRSPAVDMPWYEYYLLDVASIFLFIFILFIYVIVVLVKSFQRVILNKKYKNIKTD